MSKQNWKFGDAAPRLLVVIDPEDREQVERLARLIPHCHSPERCGQPVLCATKRLTDALREFANPKPPRPDEPTQRFAVVQDRDEVSWINWRDSDSPIRHDTPWVNADDPAESRDYVDINVVRVLSEGVTA